MIPIKDKFSDRFISDFWKFSKQILEMFFPLL